MVEENRCGSRKKAMRTHGDARPLLTQCVCVCGGAGGWGRQPKEAKADPEEGRNWFQRDAWREWNQSPDLNVCMAFSKRFPISNLFRPFNNPKVHRRVFPIAQTVKNLPAMQETQIWSLGSGRSSGESNGSPLQYSCLENPMDRGAWQATVLGVTKSRTRLRD